MRSREVVWKDVGRVGRRTLREMSLVISSPVQKVLGKWLEWEGLRLKRSTQNESK